jgi:predicted CDP-diglyceride synthetase/phosphatidate cytidylyltransferase
MSWIQIATFMGINITLVGVMTTLIIWTVTKHDRELKSMVNRLDGHASRIDQLYSIIMDMLKAGK